MVQTSPKSGPRPLGRVERTFWACADPLPAVFGPFQPPEASLRGSCLGPRMALEWPVITDVNSDPPVTPGSGGSPDRVQRGYPRSPPDNCQLPTDNRQPPSTANQQPGQIGPKTVQWKFSKSGLQPLGGSNGPFWAIVGPFGPVLYGYTGYRIPDTGHRNTHHIPVRETGKIQHGPKTSQR